MKLTVAAWPSWLLESPATLLITAWLYRPSEGASGYIIYSSGAALEKEGCNKATPFWRPVLSCLHICAV